ncbi:hypothetical protein L249_6239, partial [Ophiocordyceps polyrhachis-furcata BCC 54312]
LPEPESLAKEYFWSLPIVAERGNFFKKTVDKELTNREGDHVIEKKKRNHVIAIKRLDAKLVLVSLVPLVDFQGRLASSPNDLPALAKYSLSILLPKTPLLNRQIDPAV